MIAIFLLYVINLTHAASGNLGETYRYSTIPYLNNANYPKKGCNTCALKRQNPVQYQPQTLNTSNSRYQDLRVPIPKRYVPSQNRTPTYPNFEKNFRQNKYKHNEMNQRRHERSHNYRGDENDFNDDPMYVGILYHEEKNIMIFLNELLKKSISDIENIVYSGEALFLRMIEDIAELDDTTKMHVSDIIMQQTGSKLNNIYPILKDIMELKFIEHKYFGDNSEKFSNNRLIDIQDFYGSLNMLNERFLTNIEKIINESKIRLSVVELISGLRDYLENEVHEILGLSGLINLMYAEGLENDILYYTGQDSNLIDGINMKNEDEDVISAFYDDN